jgi:hypothetical protein
METVPIAFTAHQSVFRPTPSDKNVAGDVRRNLLHSPRDFSVLSGVPLSPTGHSRSLYLIC